MVVEMSQADPVHFQHRVPAPDDRYRIRSLEGHRGGEELPVAPQDGADRLLHLCVNQSYSHTHPIFFLKLGIAVPFS